MPLIVLTWYHTMCLLPLWVFGCCWAWRTAPLGQGGAGGHFLWVAMETPHLAILPNMASLATGGFFPPKSSPPWHRRGAKLTRLEGVSAAAPSPQPRERIPPSSFQPPPAFPSLLITISSSPTDASGRAQGLTHSLRRAEKHGGVHTGTAQPSGMFRKSIMALCTANNYIKVTHSKHPRERGCAGTG